MESNANNQAQNAVESYFDLHTTGVGYLSRIREIKKTRGPSYWGCTIGALYGSKEKPEYTYFDVILTGSEATQRVKFLQSAVANNQKVIVSFRIGDIHPEIFTYQNGEKKGQNGVCIKGRLLKLHSAKIDGEPVDFASLDQAVA